MRGRFMIRAAGLVLCLQVLSAGSVVAEEALPEVVASPPLAHGLGALPRLQGDGPSVARINATLEGVDALPMALDCMAEPILPDTYLQREAKVTFLDRHYLSITLAEGGVCTGAPHPFYEVSYLTFDMVTGEELSWDNILPETLWSAGRLTAPALEAYLAVAVPPSDPDLAADCPTLIADTGFAFWLDRERGLGLVPVGLPYILSPCLVEAYLDVTTLERLGFPAELTEALKD
jgi:hypothetical protein